MGITALGIGLPDLDKRVVQRLAFAVKNAAHDADARAGRAVVSYGRASDGAEIVAVLLGCEAEGEKGTNRLRRSLPKGHGFRLPSAWPGGRAARCRSRSRGRSRFRWRRARRPR